MLLRVTPVISLLAFVLHQLTSVIPHLLKIDRIPQIFNLQFSIFNYNLHPPIQHMVHLRISIVKQLGFSPPAGFHSSA